MIKQEFNTDKDELIRGCEMWAGDKGTRCILYKTSEDKTYFHYVEYSYAPVEYTEQKGYMLVPPDAPVLPPLGDDVQIMIEDIIESDKEQASLFMNATDRYDWKTINLIMTPYIPFHYEKIVDEMDKELSKNLFRERGEYLDDCWGDIPIAETGYTGDTYYSHTILFRNEANEYYLLQEHVEKFETDEEGHCVHRTYIKPQTEEEAYDSMHEILLEHLIGVAGAIIYELDSPLFKKAIRRDELVREYINQCMEIYNPEYKHRIWGCKDAQSD